MNKRIRFALIMVVSLFAASANGAPWAYSVNSDSGNESFEDSLYWIDLASGSDKLRGKLLTGIETRIDTEGLAVDQFGILWGIDDASRSLFQINPNNGTIKFGEEIQFLGFPEGGKNDFGMTFSCDDTLYATSVTTQTLYRLDLEGNNEAIGSVGALGVKISAIAAIGSPTRLYGLGNGDVDTPSLYSINVTTGIATPIGTQGLGAEAKKYNEAGLAFDSDGNLWAITDRRVIDQQIVDLPSQILRINVDTGAAILVSSTINEVGFESLAIGPPAKCDEKVVDADEFPRIPALNSAGRLFAILILMLAGMFVLRRRTF